MNELIAAYIIVAFILSLLATIATVGTKIAAHSGPAYKVALIAGISLLWPVTLVFAIALGCSPKLRQHYNSK